MKFTVVVKPRAKRTEILSYDTAKKTYAIAVAAPPEKNRANVELVKFLQKTLGKKVRLVSGHHAKKKIVEMF